MDRMSLGNGRAIPITGASEKDASGSLLPFDSELKDCHVVGSIERIMYFNEESGQCVLDIKSENLRSHILLSGRVPQVYPGQTVDAYIDADVLQRNSTFTDGKMAIEVPVPVKRIKIKMPTTERAVRKFLKSGAVKGIGPHLATVLAKALPDSLLQVLDHSPQQLKTIKGVGQKRQEQILESWIRYKDYCKLEEFLFVEGIPLKWAKLLWPFYESETITALRLRPYQIACKHLLPFDVIDPFALKQGFSIDSNERVRAAIYDLLMVYYKQGHCAYPVHKLVEELKSKLEVEEEVIEETLEREVISENLVSDAIACTPCIYLREIWQLEQDVARKILAFEFKEPPWGWINSQKVLKWAQGLLHIQLAPLQIQAIETALSSSLTVITGGPGTGKTTLIQSLVTILQTQFARFALCSPTGRASQRLSEATGAPAQTIHRLLKYDSAKERFTFNQQNKLNLDLVLVDEFSMVDIALMSHLLDALPDRCALILVGDADQIPPVGAGSVLQSIIASERFNTVRLTDIFRQKEKSLIKQNAHRINAGEMPITKTDGIKDFHYYPVHNSDEAKKVILNLVTETIPKTCGITDPGQFQILVPMNRGPLGTQQLNLELQEYLSLASAGTSPPWERISGFDQSFKRGDKVMVMKNDYKKDVFNGDVGFICRVDTHDQYIEIQFDERQVRYTFDELDRLTLAYAITIHKSQGSEYRAVIVVITDEHLPMAQRHLIYTAVTRGKEHVFLVADPTALQMAISSDENNRRWQKLTELLIENGI